MIGYSSYLNSYLRIFGCHIYSTCNLVCQIDEFNNLTTLMPAGQLDKVYATSPISATSPLATSWELHTSSKRRSIELKRMIRLQISQGLRGARLKSDTKRREGSIILTSDESI